MPKRKNDDTTLRLPLDFKATLGALLRTPPPPPGDPSTRKLKPEKAKGGRKKTAKRSI